MQKAQIAIIGAGLSGLFAAYMLQKRGVMDYVILEARDAPGGRIVSAPLLCETPDTSCEQSNITDRFDLGPSWFWPGYQRQLDQLVEELGLRRFEQYETGEMLVERSADSAVMRMRGYVNSPPSMRLVGGMGALTDSLYAHLDPKRVLTGQVVRYVCRKAQSVEVQSTDSKGQVSTWSVEKVFLAMPPRLVHASIEFSPALPSKLSQSWKATATWMAPHAKYFAIFDKPFWREQGLSGEGRSSVGPLVEIHDATTAHGSAALFGFVGIPATLRRALPESDLRALCRAQLVRMFGSQARRPKAELLKDWAAQPFTAIEADLKGANHHAAAPAATADSGPWRDCLIGIASEWSPEFPGYVAGAIDAVSRGMRLFSTSA
ncbi:flavin monoamine oxidase family protein [Pseudomonas sp. NPDC089569]|uniref:flavin monoamine oxidase family protein n=1 Tax=Pseudomonas sp. NPDC089569 TaxID=3390722 RepID=UPI003D055585